ncbi:hypothetical protein BD413DRAFT_520301 [Trametes elegans]|nr:hypothetical protein BD413DRAFT_520301 [Trametes elegans]
MRRLPEQYLHQISFRPASANTSPITLRQLCQGYEAFRGLVDSHRVLFTETDTICISIIWPGYVVLNEGLRVGPGHGAFSGVCTMGELANRVGCLYSLFLWKIKHYEYPEGENPHWSISKNPHLFNKDTICIKGIHRLVGKSFQVLVEILPPHNATHGLQA